MASRETYMIVNQSLPDPAQYCAMAPHWDFVWLEMQHGTLSYADVEKMIAACPRVGVPIIRVRTGTVSVPAVSKNVCSLAHCSINSPVISAADRIATVNTGPSIACSNDPETGSSALTTANPSGDR
mgnify:CR=1 FL=1